MRVVYFSPCWPPDRVPNGIATYVQGVRRGLAALDCESQVLTHDPGPGEPGKDVIPLLPDRGPLAARLRIRAAAMWSRHLGLQQDVGGRIGRQLAALDAERSIDVFEMEETFGSAARVPDYFSKPVVVRLHGPHCILGPTLGEPEDREYHLRCRAERKAITRASVVTSPGHSALAVVREFYGLELPNARVIPNPVAEVADADRWRLEGSEAGRILFVGRFDRIKGADTLLDAFVDVAGTRKSARLVFLGPDNGLILGARTLDAPTYLDEFVPRTLHARIEIRGAQPRRVVDAERRKARVTVVASRYETFSMTTAEAMAAGSPVVAPRTGGVTDLIEEGRNGLLFEPGDGADLARQVGRLLDDVDLAARLGDAARRDAIERFSEARVAGMTNALYAELLEERGR